MARFIPQFSIISSIKNFVRKSGRAKDVSLEEPISEAIAKRIQHKAYEAKNKPHKKTFYPPYLKIAEQLQVENEQIFYAAVSALTDTALNIPHYRRHIMQLLEDTKKNSSLNAKKEKLLNKSLSKIKNVMKHTTKI